MVNFSFRNSRPRLKSPVKVQYADFLSDTWAKYSSFISNDFFSHLQHESNREKENYSRKKEDVESRRKTVKSKT